MHLIRLIIAAAFAISIATPYAAAQSRMLGIPFGEKIVLTLCPINSEKSKVPCWIEAPFLFKPTGSKSGLVHLPMSEDRPEWAAHAMFRISLDKNSRVQELKVNTSSARNKSQISESISTRFGKPVQDELFRRDISSATWRSSEGFVEMRCKDECWIEFRTLQAQSERESELAERAKVNAARPKLP
jgi:hypothetical protein